MYQLEGHLTRDFMERLWGSFDVISYSGGKATIDGVEGSSTEQSWNGRHPRIPYK